LSHIGQLAPCDIDGARGLFASGRTDGTCRTKGANWSKTVSRRQSRTVGETSAIGRMTRFSDRRAPFRRNIKDNLRRPVVRDLFPTRASQRPLQDVAIPLRADQEHVPRLPCKALTYVFARMGTSYAIEPDPNGGFLVRTIGSKGGRGQIAVGFSTRAKAQDWINDRLRFADRDPSPSKDS
jgi:hypothetical protein